jgi:hypothetical protein
VIVIKPRPRLKLDDEAIVTVVAEELDEEERQFYLLRWDTHPGVRLSDIKRQRQQDAVNRARAGDWRLLADLVRRGIPLNSEAGNLVAARLLGKIKKKGTRGPPKKPIEERRLASPSIGADEEYELIWPILREHFPEERIGAIKARALQIAAQRAGIKDVKTLENYRKSKRRVR